MLLELPVWLTGRKALPMSMCATSLGFLQQLRPATAAPRVFGAATIRVLSPRLRRECSEPSSSARCISTSPRCHITSSGKYKTTNLKNFMLTYEMAQKPWHIGVRKAWMTWHTQDLEEFRQTQPYQVAQDEIIRRFFRGFFLKSRTIDGEELVIKRRGNLVTVGAFIRVNRYTSLPKMYWMIGFAEEFLSLLLKQPVRLEIQSVIGELDLAYRFI